MSAAVPADPPVGFGVMGVGLIANLAIRKHRVPCRLIIWPLYRLATRS